MKIGNAEIFNGHYADMLDNVSADLILTSPPYNIGSSSPAVTGTRSSKDGTYDPKSYRGIREYFDDLPEEEYQASQVGFLQWAAKTLSENGILAYQHKPRRKDKQMIHPMQWLLKVPDLVLMEEIIWDRSSTHNHSRNLMWPHTERIYILRKAGGKYLLNNDASLDFRSDVWRIPRASVNGHNAPFSEALARAVIKAWSKEGDTVVDPYLGSGTTAVAAISQSRKFIGSELLPNYFDMSVERIKNAC